MEVKWQDVCYYLMSDGWCGLVDSQFVHFFYIYDEYIYLPNRSRRLVCCYLVTIVRLSREEMQDTKEIA